MARISTKILCLGPVFAADYFLTLAKRTVDLIHKLGLTIFLLKYLLTQNDQRSRCRQRNCYTFFPSWYCLAAFGWSAIVLYFLGAEQHYVREGIWMCLHFFPKWQKLTTDFRFAMLSHSLFTISNSNKWETSCAPEPKGTDAVQTWRKSLPPKFLTYK